MQYFLKENRTGGLYVGSHSKTQCQLQILEYAVPFETREEAEISKQNLEKNCGLELEIIELK